MDKQSSLKGLPPPYNSKSIPRRRGHIQVALRFLKSRRGLCSLALIAFLFILKLLSSGIPSTYRDIRAYERSLPQHNVTEAMKEGTRYLRIPKPVSGRGFNNVLQESLLLSYLAAEVNRAFVFEDYVWSHSPLPYTIYDLALRPSRMPMNAFISGPTAGGPMSGPRAVSAEFWDTVCPASKRKVISSRDQPDNVEGAILLDWWIEKLEKVKDRCVEIESEKKTIFDFMLFGDTRILSLWTGLSKSSIFADFRWSSLVQSTVTSNLAAIHPAAAKTSSAIAPLTTLPGLVAIHLRRGDFKGHCKYLLRWNAKYMGFNRFPEMLDKFDSSNDRPPEMLRQYYMDHCMPEIDQVVERLRAVRMANPGLNRVYALTNGKASWINGLKDALQKDGWVDVKSSVDLRLDSAQKFVSMAVDMAIAEKAEVFIGNGFSSLTANVVTLRMAKGLPTSSNRLL
ncbi:hypothetical protein FPV67DRAFT_640352 [Lyophyllum atratum]|nr:hypothetical protein FPV67DRAFT_640352 [Lyophyllum atratum]